MAKTNCHHAYIADAPEQFRGLLSQLRAQLSQALPDALEVIKYDMPGFQIERRSSRATLSSASNAACMSVQVRSQAI